ncbi:hypothetical protein [Actinomadura rudentiformis]|uniref:hypothetical protein n=1 Tax=Actinomadura rudentiformis TaxID=359158 RepID=UPI00178C4BCF|nr:hypothetical protein [Actinomadura rudentiformis]
MTEAWDGFAETSVAAPAHAGGRADDDPLAFRHEEERARVAEAVGGAGVLLDRRRNSDPVGVGEEDDSETATTSADVPRRMMTPVIAPGQ